MNKAAVFILVTVAFVSLFLPYQEFESSWGGFVLDAAGNILEEGVDDNIHILGYELIFPIYVVIMIITGTLFSGIVKIESAKIIGFVFGCLNLVLACYTFFLVSNPAEAKPHSMFHPPIPIIGIGSYILLFTSVAGVVFASLRFSHK